MRSCLRPIVVVTFAILVGSPATAFGSIPRQTQYPKPQWWEVTLRALDLSEVQTDEMIRRVVHPVLRKQREEMFKHLANMSPDARGRAERPKLDPATHTKLVDECEAARQAFEHELIPVLSDEQLTRLPSILSLWESEFWLRNSEHVFALAHYDAAYEVIAVCLDSPHCLPSDIRAVQELLAREIESFPRILRDARHDGVRTNERQDVASGKLQDADGTPITDSKVAQRVLDEIATIGRSLERTNTRLSERNRLVLAKCALILPPPVKEHLAYLHLDLVCTEELRAAPVGIKTIQRIANALGDSTFYVTPGDVGDQTHGPDVPLPTIASRSLRTDKLLALEACEARRDRRLQLDVARFESFEAMERFGKLAHELDVKRATKALAALQAIAAALPESPASPARELLGAIDMTDAIEKQEQALHALREAEPAMPRSIDPQ